MSRSDRLLIAMIALVAIATWPVAGALARGTASDRATIVAPGGATVVSLSETRGYSVAGSMGTVTVRVDGGSVRVMDSPCQDQVCVHTGAVSASGGVIACVPNGVVVRVGGGDDGGLDARMR